MSETFPFGAAAADAAPESDGNRTKVLAVLAGLIALVLLAFFVVMPMLSGGAEEPVTPVKRAARTSTKAKAKAKPAAKAPAKTVAPTFNDSFERDPFKPLYVAPKAVSNPAPNPAGAPAAGGAPVTGGAPATGGAPVASSAQVGSARVALVDVFVRNGKTFAQTKVNDAVHTPAVGADFGGSYRLLGATGTCATYLYGDEQFRLCEGQEVLK